MAIAHIEEHITDQLNTEEIAKVAGCSIYHFQRMFACMTGIPLSEYIRRRRMSLAVTDLKGDHVKVIDVALKYGYNSPTAFNRAFQSVHGIAPSLVKLDGVSVKSYPPLSFQMIVKGVESLDFRLEKKEAFRVVGTSIMMDGDMEFMTQPMNQLWEAVEKNGMLDRIKSLNDDDASELFEVMVPDDNTEEWKYMLAVPSSAEVDEKLEEYTVGAYTWAIFSDDGQTTEEGLGYRVIKEWLPTSGYEYDDGPDINVYFKGDSNGTKSEFWIPVRKAEKCSSMVSQLCGSSLFRSASDL